MKRVVVTGMAGLSPLGNDLETTLVRLHNKEAAISHVPEWDEIRGMRTRLAGQITNFVVPEYYPRKNTRSMGRVALLATRSAELAINDASLNSSQELKSGQLGIAYGSSIGSPTALNDFIPLRFNNQRKGISATSYLQMMPHTCAANIALFFGITGRIIPTCSACTSGSQAIGYAYETVKHGYQKVMLAGGAEELCVTIVAVFDSMYASSIRNNEPDKAVRPFDRDRDGLVISEGACTIVLEELSHAEERGAQIHGEIVGYGTNSDGLHLTNPSPDRMAQAMKLALQDAKLSPTDIGYINAHATATEHGDIAESQSTNSLFATNTPVSSVKGYLGHTLGACGALEAWFTLGMMKQKWFAPTLNLDHIDPRCADLWHITGNGLTREVEYAISNNFAFGGTNTALIFRRWSR